MHLIEAYALQSGLKIDKPIITEEYFPLPYEKYICVHNGGGNGKFDSKIYDYWNDVIELIAPHIEGYKLVQIGDKDDKLLPRIDADLRGKTNVKQSAYILKRAVMHFGNDSFPIHLAGAVDTPSVSIYGPTTIANHGPYWFNPKSIFIESKRNGGKACFSRQESPKSINMIYPEEIANAILKVLGLEQINIKTLYIGPRYGATMIELIPDVLVHPNSLQGKNPNIRLDYYFDEENTFKTLSHVGGSIITDKPLDLNILKQLRKNIGAFAFEVKEDTDLNYLLDAKYASMPLQLFSKESDKKKLSRLRAKFFDVGTIEYLDENPKPIKDFEFSEDLHFKSSKVVIGRGKIYNSLAHYKAEKENNFDLIDSEDFWKDKNFFWIHHGK